MPVLTLPEPLGEHRPFEHREGNPVNIHFVCMFFCNYGCNTYICTHIPANTQRLKDVFSTSEIGRSVVC